MTIPNTINGLLDKMWHDYVLLNPDAKKITSLIESKGDDVVNDHIALRTFNHPRLNIDKIAAPFLNSGYKEMGTYNFNEKKLFAKHYESTNEDMPKIFISELLLEEFSPKFNAIVNKVIDQISDEDIKRFDFTCIGRNWKITSEEYEILQKESEYGAWLCAIGFRPNHFTLFINKMKSFSEVSDLNTFLKESGFTLNSSGGEVKGSKDVLLEQSSTMANHIEVEFTDKSLTIPSCYFEFAKRYPMNNGKLYQGFVAASADKIFESTDKK